MINKNSIFSSKWQEILKSEFSKEYFQDLKKFLKTEYKNHNIFPSKNKIFEAINKTAFDDIKIVIIGQDPYHGKGQANGIAFSVNDGINKPPSLKNILKELSDDLKLNSESVKLKNWTKQGVLLLNSILTVRENKPSSHKNQGWEIFTTKIIKNIAREKKNIIFILWGNYALQKIKKIDLSNHFILKSPHPSPLSSYRGFFGCKHFSKANKILKKLKKEQVKWV